MIDAGVINVQQQLAISPASSAEGGEGDAVEDDLCSFGSGSGRADDVGFGPAVGEELLDGVTEFAVGGETAEVTLEVAEVEDVLSAVADAFGGVSHEGGD